jgi:hypothetical protein
LQSTTKTDCHSKNITKLDQGLEAPFKKTGFCNATSRGKVTSPDLEAPVCYKLDEKEPKNQGDLPTLIFRK